MAETIADGASLEETKRSLYDSIDPLNLAPLWEHIHEMMSTAPVTEATPHVWRYADVRPKLLEAGSLIPPEDAERRTLMLENPSMRGKRRITEALYTGLQLILPGEVAPAHRHSPSAMRMVFESEGAYSSINGERCAMEPGDLVLNQSWHWHGHTHDGSEPHISMTCLDMPLVRFLGPLFAESYPDAEHPDTRPLGDARARYGATMLPIGNTMHNVHSPVFHYPYAETREALLKLYRAGEIDPYHGIKMEYVNPVTAGPVLPTLSAFMQYLPKGFETATYQTTAAWVYAAIEGEGRTTVGDTVLEWGPRDIFVVPAWYPHHHEADGDAFLYSYSDKGVHEKLGLFREVRGNEAS